MRRFCALLLCAIVLATCMLPADATTPVGPKPEWATPSVKALKKVSPTPGAQHESSFYTNVDCQLIDYRLVNASTMRSGCFTETSFGLYDGDDGAVIFASTDEAVPLISYFPGQSLVPWPRASSLVSLNTVNTGGTLLSIYRNPLGVMQDERNLIGQLVDKKLSAPPDLIIRDAEGQPIVVNPESIAFSDNGSWLVAETLTGTFVRINLATLSQAHFAPAYGSSGSPALLRSQVAISDAGKYIAVANDAANALKVYDLNDCPPASGNCPAYNYQPFVSSQIVGLQRIRHLRFVNAGLLSFEASSLAPDSAGIYELAPTEGITSLTDYLGLGDSYTSGEGAFDYRSGTDSSSNMCHLSARSYPLLLTRDLFSPSGGHSVACSGAVVRDVASTSDNYRGQVVDGLTYAQLNTNEPALLQSVVTNYIPGYLAQQRFVGIYQPRIVTVSVGGDDLGFGDIVENCVIPHVSQHLSDSNCYSTYEDRRELTDAVDRMARQWTSLYKQLAGTAPGSQIYAIGYPTIGSDTGSCALNVHLSKNELEFAQEMVHYINSTIQKSAQAAGVRYVDITDALAGHQLCETASYNVAVNGLTAGKDGGILGVNLFGKESYHPNALGQELIEQAILIKTHNFTVAPTLTTPIVSKILEAPKTGRPVLVKVPAKNVAPAVAKAGKSIAVRAVGESYGLKPASEYSVHLDGSTGPLIGTATTDMTGSIAVDVTVPPGTSPGGHTIDVMGSNQTGGTIVITQPIYVPASNTDSDGDGISDDSDACPGAANNGTDADRDGIDDTCDPLISQPPASTPAAPTSATSVPPNISQTDVPLPLGTPQYDPSATLTSFRAAAVTTSTGTSKTTPRVFGATTASVRPAHTHGRGHVLKRLAVLHWARLLMVFWLLLILCVCAYRLAGRSAGAVQ